MLWARCPVGVCIALAPSSPCEGPDPAAPGTVQTWSRDTIPAVQSSQPPCAKRALAAPVLLCAHLVLPRIKPIPAFPPVLDPHRLLSMVRRGLSLGWGTVQGDEEWPRPRVLSPCLALRGEGLSELIVILTGLRCRTAANRSHCALVASIEVCRGSRREVQPGLCHTNGFRKARCIDSF